MPGSSVRLAGFGRSARRLAPVGFKATPATFVEEKRRGRRETPCASPRLRDRFSGGNRQFIWMLGRPLAQASEGQRLGKKALVSRRPTLQQRTAIPLRSEKGRCGPTAISPRHGLRLAHTGLGHPPSSAGRVIDRRGSRCRLAQSPRGARRSWSRLSAWKKRWRALTGVPLPDLPIGSERSMALPLLPALRHQGEDSVRRRTHPIPPARRRLPDCGGRFHHLRALHVGAS